MGRGGLEAARKDLEVVARSEVIGMVESELAADLVDPSKAVIPGALAL